MDTEHTPPRDTPKEHRPLSETGKRTQPPGNGERDEPDIAKGEDKLKQAGGGH